MKFEPCVMIGRWIDISGFIVQSVTGIQILIKINVRKTKVGDIKEYTVTGIYRLIIINVSRTKVGDIKEYTVTGIYRLIIINVCRTKVG